MLQNKITFNKCDIWVVFGQHECKKCKVCINSKHSNFRVNGVDEKGFLLKKKSDCCRHYFIVLLNKTDKNS